MQVFQGVLLAAGDRFAVPKAGAELPPFAGSVTSPGGYLLSLWQHESLRTFCDKMISPEDKTWVGDAIHSLCKCEEPPLLFCLSLHDPAACP